MFLKSIFLLLLISNCAFAQNLSFGLSSSNVKKITQHNLGFSADVKGQRPLATPKRKKDTSKVPEFKIEKSKTQTRGNDSIYITHPPKGWECINDPQQLPQKVKIIFVGSGQGNNPFTPSINLATEATTLSLNEYIAQAKAYHEGRAGTRCNLIGPIQTNVGPAQLLQIERASQWGDIRFLQAVYIQDSEAYVITATCLKSDFPTLSSQIFKAIQSFSLPICQND